MRTLAVILLALTVVMAGMWWRSTCIEEGFDWMYRDFSGVSVVASRGRLGILHTTEWIGPPLRWRHESAAPISYDNPQVDVAGFLYCAWATEIHVYIPFWFLMVLTAAPGMACWRRHRRRRVHGFDVLPPSANSLR